MKDGGEDSGESRYVGDDGMRLSEVRMMCMKNGEGWPSRDNYLSYIVNQLVKDAHGVNGMEC